MGRARPSGDEIPNGLTMSDLARELSHRLGRPVTTQRLNYLIKRRSAVPVGHRTVTTLQPVTKVLDAVAPEHVDQLEAAYREVYHRA